MWLRTKKEKEALFFWQQAKSFFFASQNLPNTSKPLTSYYCFLNAVKTLLLVKNIHFHEKHGVSGKRNGQISFNNEIVSFKNSGILPSLQEYFGEPRLTEDFTIKKLLQNLVFIHRVYNMTYSSSPELFIPLKNVQFVKAKRARLQGSAERDFWLSAKFDTDIVDGNLINSLPSTFEYIDNYIRSKKRFKWINNDPKNINNKNELIEANKFFRKKIVYIKGLKTHWYLRKDIANSITNKSMPTIVFAIMHRLSELSRYSPDILAKYLESKHNWILAEFLDTSIHQFIDQISSEITGYDFQIGKNIIR